MNSSSNSIVFGSKSSSMVKESTKFLRFLAVFMILIRLEMGFFITKSIWEEIKDKPRRERQVESVPLLPIFLEAWFPLVPCETLILDLVIYIHFKVGTISCICVIGELYDFGILGNDHHPGLLVGWNPYKPFTPPRLRKTKKYGGRSRLTYFFDKKIG